MPRVVIATPGVAFKEPTSPCRASDEAGARAPRLQRGVSCRARAALQRDRPQEPTTISVPGMVARESQMPGTTQPPPAEDASARAAQRRRLRGVIPNERPSTQRPRTQARPGFTALNTWTDSSRGTARRHPRRPAPPRVAMKADNTVVIERAATTMSGGAPGPAHSGAFPEQPATVADFGRLSAAILATSPIASGDNGVNSARPADGASTLHRGRRRGHSHRLARRHHRLHATHARPAVRPALMLAASENRHPARPAAPSSCLRALAGETSFQRGGHGHPPLQRGVSSRARAALHHERPHDSATKQRHRHHRARAAHTGDHPAAPQHRTPGARAAQRRPVRRAHPGTSGHPAGGRGRRRQLASWH